MFSLKINYFELCDDYGVTASRRHTWDVGTVFVCMEREAPSYTMVLIRCICGFDFQVYMGLLVTSLGHVGKTRKVENKFYPQLSW